MNPRWLGAAAAALLVLAAPCYADDEFLDPEDAFRFSARLEPSEMFEVRYLIADGYYLYRDRFRFEVQADSVVMGPPQYPPAQWHEDEFFGRSQIYRGELTIRIPIVQDLGAGQTIRLVAVSQGCADAGICYLPTTQTVEFEMFGPLGDPGRSR